MSNVTIYVIHSTGRRLTDLLLLSSSLFGLKINIYIYISILSGKSEIVGVISMDVFIEFQKKLMHEHI